MPVWTIDGEVTAAEVRNRKGKYVVLRHLQIRCADGTEHELKTVCAAGEVADALTPGSRGRFYVSKALDQTGVHAVRLEGGTSAHVWHNNMELMGMITLGAGAIMTLIVLGGYRGIAMFGMLGLPLGAIILFYMRKARIEGQKQFEADITAGLVS